MIKIVFLMKRRPDVPLRDFLEHWKGDHARLVTSYAEPLRIRRYVQSHTIPAGVLAAFRPEWAIEGDEGWDGIAEVWLDSLDVLAGSRGTPEMDDIQDVLLADEATFVDLERSTVIITEEHVIIDGP